MCWVLWIVEELFITYNDGSGGFEDAWSSGR
jgi:hypothetical protein